MRKKTSLLVGCFLAVGAALFCFCLPACLKDKIKESYGHDSLSVTYTLYSPTYTLKSSVLASINGSAGQPIVQPGQLYIKGAYIYLNDVNAGIHIIDNSDPANPVQKAFLNIPGNQNIAIRGNTLYADMYSDLLAIDISNPLQAKITGELWSAFPGRSSSADSTVVVTSWNIHDTTYKLGAYGDPLAQQGPFYGIPGTVFYTLDAGAVSAASNYISAVKGPSTTGIAGSTASMVMVGNYIYAIPEPHSLGVIDVSDPTQLKLVNRINAGFDLETVFPLQDKLLLGSMDGVYIYSIADATKPVEIGTFAHGKTCDPVISDGQYAYVTLKSGTYCGGAANELDVLSAQDLTNTSLLKSYSMTSPNGLCKDGSLLFVCDSTAVKVFNTTDVSNLQTVAEVNVNGPHDAIALNHLLIVVAQGGLYQFDYTDPSHINQLSYLSIK